MICLRLQMCMQQVIPLYHFFNNFPNFLSKTYPRNFCWSQRDWIKSWKLEVSKWRESPKITSYDIKRRDEDLSQLKWYSYYYYYHLSPSLSYVCNLWTKWNISYYRRNRRLGINGHTWTIAIIKVKTVISWIYFWKIRYASDGRSLPFFIRGS